MSKAPRLNVRSGPEPQMVPGQKPEEPKREPMVLDASQALAIPHVHRLLTDAQAILGNELTQLHSLTKKGQLTPKQTQQFARYVHALTEVAREEREQLKLDDLDRMSDEELLAMLLESPEIMDRVRRLLSARRDEP